ncbi:MAG TPA: hypothetical protein VL198_17335 [Pseudolabrys sp.]|jgi:hypothetical protein|nr:hypothetical protein [Pseudolabrys sp.]
MNDPAETKRIVEQTQFLRGAYISSYAQVEFFLADICVKAWELPEYKQLRTKFPYKAESRVKAAKALFDCAGPLAQYRDEVRGLFDELLHFEEFRDFLAHGLLRIDTKRSDFSCHFRMYKPVKNGLKIDTVNVPVTDLAKDVAQIVAFTHRFVTLFRRVYLEQKLELPPS